MSDLETTLFGEKTSLKALSKSLESTPTKLKNFCQKNDIEVLDLTGVPYILNSNVDVLLKKISSLSKPRVRKKPDRNKKT